MMAALFSFIFEKNSRPSTKKPEITVEKAAACKKNSIRYCLFAGSKMSRTSRAAGDLRRRSA